MTPAELKQYIEMGFTADFIMGLESGSERIGATSSEGVNNNVATTAPVNTSAESSNVEDGNNSASSEVAAALLELKKAIQGANMKSATVSTDEVIESVEDILAGWIN